MLKSTLIVFISFMILFSGCTTKEVVMYDNNQEVPMVSEAEPVVEETPQQVNQDEILRVALVQSALKYLNKKDGKDCSGFVHLINTQNNDFYYSSSDLSKFFTNEHRSKAIYNMMKKEYKLVQDETPKIADLVFFEDTFQKTKRNKGALNITHVGIITQIDDDGTIHFIHHSRGTNRIDQLNMKYAASQNISGKNVNSYLKQCDAKTPKQQCLSSYFFSSFATPIQNEHIELTQK
ncbi:MAG: hypothetical protein QG559_920 [Campylobacterota bacterium]|nr:hypothetical protein [Campylobacterota bacterium]